MTDYERLLDKIERWERNYKDNELLGRLLYYPGD